MKEYAKWFYLSQVWKDTRDNYVRSVGGLCEECLKDGIVTAGVIVHHKIHITPENIHDENITLSHDNLKLVCRDCHAKEHRNKKRYSVDELGRII